MIIANYIKSYKAIITLGLFIAVIPLLGIPSWIRDILTYISGLSVALGVYLLFRKPESVTTIKESLDEHPTVGFVSDTKSDFSSLNPEA